MNASSTNASSTISARAVLRLGVPLLGLCLLWGCDRGERDGRPPARRPEHRLLVVGWVGATWDLLDPLLARGELPHLAGLIERGFSARLESTIVPISSAAWCAAVTGKGPGKNGVYSFFPRKPGSYEVELVDSRRNRAVPIWRTLSRRRLSSVVFGLPVTFPPEPIRGVMVAGMLSPHDAEYAWPPGTADRLRARGFVPDLGMWRRNRPILDAAEVERQLSIKDELLRETLEAEDWTLAWVVFKSLDVLSHAAYDGDPDGRVGQLVRRLDRSLGSLLETVGEETNVLLLSDHGFRTYPRVFNPMAWLLAQGLAAPDPETGDGSRASGPLAESRVLDRSQLLGALDLRRTAVFPTKCEGHFGGLRLNIAGREPEGIVDAAERGARLEDLRRRLLALRDPGGARVVVRVLDGHERYPGPYSEQLPDLLFETRDIYLVHAAPRGAILAQAPNLPDHDLWGIWAGAGPDIAVRAGRELEASIEDVTPTALQLLGLPVYDDFEGSVCTEVFAAAPSIRRVAEADDPPDRIECLRFLRADSSLTEEQREELHRRMSDLGYVE